MMRLKLKQVVLSLTVIALVVMLYSCFNSRIFYRFTSVDVAGWERNDTLRFMAPKYNGSCVLTVYVRTTSLYPYRNLSLKVIDNGRERVANFTLLDKENEQRGQKGIAATELSCFVGRVWLNQKHNSSILVVHNMQREILPGISDVGISLDQRSR